MSARVVDFPRYQAERLRTLDRRSGLRFLALLMTVGVVLTWVVVAAGNPQAVGRATLEVLRPVAPIGAVLGVLVWLVSRRLGGPDPDERARVQAGLRAEERVARTLAERLPKGYVLINNLPLRRGGDVDHLVVGPRGIFVLETKAHGGELVCGADGTWHRTKYGRGGGAYDAYIGDPTAQTERLVRRINGLLRAGGCRDLAASGAIIFASEDAVVDDSGSRVPAFCLRDVLGVLGAATTHHLGPGDVDRAVRAVLAGSEQPAQRQARRPNQLRRKPGQAAVEVAVALPTVLMLTVGVLGGYRVASTAMAVGAVAREAARAAAVAPDAGTASSRGVAHGQDTAAGLGLRGVHVTVDARDFGPGGTVRASAAYTVELGDLPLVGWAHLPVQRQHAEPVDLYRGFAASVDSR